MDSSWNVVVGSFDACWYFLSDPEGEYDEVLAECQSQTLSNARLAVIQDETMQSELDRIVAE